MNSRLLDHNAIPLTTRPTPRHWSVVVMTSCIFEEDLAHVITHEALLKSIMEGQASFKPSLCILQTKQVLSQAAQQGFHLFGKINNVAPPQGTTLRTSYSFDQL